MLGGCQLFFLIVLFKFVEGHAEFFARGVPEVHLGVQEIDVDEGEWLVAGVHHGIFRVHRREF